MSTNNTQYTRDLYNNFQIAYNWFNEKLFQNQLCQCIVTLNRLKGSYGYFRPETFTELSNPTNFISEISLNPDMLTRPIKEVLATLVHEMCHLWCDMEGYKSRKGFHIRQWGEKMLEVGLQPISAKTQEPAISGAKMHHKIIDGELFDLVCDELLKEVKFNIVNVPVVEKKKKDKEKTKFKYFCECEDVEFTGKRGLEVICKSCGAEFVMQEE